MTTRYHDALQELSYRFVHLIEEAFDIPVGTFDTFFKPPVSISGVPHNDVPPQHRIKLVKYPPHESSDTCRGQGVGAHKDSSGWLTFLYQVGREEGLEVLVSNGEWVAAPPIDGTFVVNFGNAFEAATDGAVKATIHRVKVGFCSFLVSSFAFTNSIGTTICINAPIFYSFLSRASSRPHRLRNPVIHSCTGPSTPSADGRDLSERECVQFPR